MPPDFCFMLPTGHFLVFIFVLNLRCKHCWPCYTQISHNTKTSYWVDWYKFTYSSKRESGWCQTGLGYTGYAGNVGFKKCPFQTQMRTLIRILISWIFHSWPKRRKILKHFEPPFSSLFSGEKQNHKENTALGGTIYYEVWFLDEKAVTFNDFSFWRKTP